MIKEITKKKLFQLFFILFVSVGVFIYLWRFINSYLSRSRATSTSAILSILPSNTNLNVNETKEFQLMLQFTGGNTSEKIDYLKVVVNFPKNYLELADYINTIDSRLDRQMRVDGPVAANSSGMIVIELGAIARNSGPSTNSPVTVAKIKFKGKAAGSGQITIGGYQIVNNASEELTQVTKNNSQITVGALKWNITLQAVCQTPSKVLKPETKIRMFRILWPWVNPSGYNPRDFNCRVDSEEGNNSSTHFMEILSENPLNNTQGIYVGLELPVRDNKKAACSEGVAFEPYEITPSVPNICSNIPPSGDYICFSKYFNPYNFMARWSYNRLAPGNYTIKVRIPDQYCYNPPSTRTPTPTPTPTPTLTSSSTPTPTPTQTQTSNPTPTPTPTPIPNATNLTLNLSLRFQGIVNQCPANNKKIKVKVKLGGKTNTEYKSTDFSCNQGIWTGSLTFNATPGSGYIVYVKGEKHLQKKICDNTPQESRLGPGTYNCNSGQINLNSGTNNLNFTEIVNLYGDLPVGGEQDGVINSLDSSFIRNNLGKSDPQVLDICDGNLDGICDTQDWSMLIMALSIKGDEL